MRGVPRCEEFLVGRVQGVELQTAPGRGCPAGMPVNFIACVLGYGLGCRI